MIATLFGGGLSGQVDTLLTLILDEIRYSGCKQVLLIPFARMKLPALTDGVSPFSALRAVPRHAYLVV